ncbi:MAG: phosphatase PAP2 family protein [Actinobacteria bacterium]|nr:MAG: phosphatase PAP2 family protein [Actinomycetota bacterium]
MGDLGVAPLVRRRGRLLALTFRTGRRFVLDFVPFAALILLYGELRGLVHVIRPHPYYLPQLHAERWLFGGHVPTVDLQHWLWAGHERWLDHALLFVTNIHSVVPITLAFLLWLRRRPLFYRFAASTVVLSYAAVVTFLLYPAAPPWAAGKIGLLDVVEIGGPEGATSTGVIHGNPYAAIPSLHAGYAFMVFLMIASLTWPTRHRRLAVAAAALYPAVQSFAVVYTANHYVVDVLIGYAFAAAAYFSVRTVWRRRGFPG